MKCKKTLTALIALALFGNVAGTPNFVNAQNNLNMPVKINLSNSNESVAKTYAQEVLRLVNIERANHGVAPLRLSDNLTSGATIRANEISKFMSHTRPNGQKFYTVFNDSEGQYTMGENIAAGYDSPEAVVKGWMNSPGHRANILNSDYEELGVGYFYDQNSEYKNFWVQIFKRPISKAYR